MYCAFFTIFGALQTNDSQCLTVVTSFAQLVAIAWSSRCRFGSSRFIIFIRRKHFNIGNCPQECYQLSMTQLLRPIKEMEHKEVLPEMSKSKICLGISAKDRCSILKHTASGRGASWLKTSLIGSNKIMKSGGHDHI